MPYYSQVLERGNGRPFEVKWLLNFPLNIAARDSAPNEKSESSISNRLVEKFGVIFFVHPEDQEFKNLIPDFSCFFFSLLGNLLALTPSSSHSSILSSNALNGSLFPFTESHLNPVAPQTIPRVPRSARSPVLSISLTTISSFST